MTENGYTVGSDWNPLNLTNGFFVAAKLNVIRRIAPGIWFLLPTDRRLVAAGSNLPDTRRYARSETAAR